VPREALGVVGRLGALADRAGAALGVSGPSGVADNPLSGVSDLAGAIASGSKWEIAGAVVAAAATRGEAGTSISRSQKWLRFAGGGAWAQRNAEGIAQILPVSKHNQSQNYAKMFGKAFVIDSLEGKLRNREARIRGDSVQIYSLAKADKELLRLALEHAYNTSSSRFIILEDFFNNGAGFERQYLKSCSFDACFAGWRPAEGGFEGRPLRYWRSPSEP
jgi:hypothetical protein